MKKLYYLTILLTSLILTNCDGRNRAYKSNEDVLKKHGLYESFNKHVKFIPSEYSEIVKDTILSNGFSIRIKSYTNMSKSVVSEELDKNSILQQEHHRDWISEITVRKNDKVVFADRINTYFYNKNNIEIESTDKAISTLAYVDEERSIKEGSSVIILGQLYIDKKKFSAYELNIGASGNYTLKSLI